MNKHTRGGFVFLWVVALIYVAWSAVPLVNSKFLHGYPSMGTERPGPFVSTRYGWDWVLLLIVSSNVLLIGTLALAIVGRAEYQELHSFLVYLFAIVNTVVLLLFLFRWAFAWNWYHSWFNTAFNDYRWCGRYYSSTDGARDACGNIAPFESANLSINVEGRLHLAYTLVAIVLAMAHGKVQSSLRKFGVLR